MRAFARFARRVPGRELFKHPTFAGDLRAQAHNEWTLCLWALFEEERISEKTGKRIKASTIEQRISLFKGLVSHRYGFQIAGEAPRLKSLVRAMRAKDPLEGYRKKRRALRHRHLAKLWRTQKAVRARDFLRLNRWAALVTSRHILARGGELGTVMRNDLTFRTDARGRRYAVVMLRPLKKKGLQQPKVPQIIAEFDQGEGADTYAALRRLTEADIWAFRGDWDTTPLFRVKPGTAMSTAHYRAAVREAAKLLGFDPAHFGAHSTRIGGASDLAGTGRASQLLLQAKGRWSSDIGRIYARMTRKAQIAVSDLMYSCKGRDLEERMPDFVQPA